MLKKKKSIFPLIGIIIFGIILFYGVSVLFGLFGEERAKSDSIIDELQEIGKELGYKNALSDLKEIHSNEMDGITYQRMQQNYNGIPVYGKSIVCVTNQNNEIQSLFGNIEDIDESMETNPTIKADEIKVIIQEYINHQWKTEEVQLLEISEIDDSSLVVYKTKQDSTACLAYCVDVSFYTEFYECYELIIDAISGEVLAVGNTLDDESVKGYKSSDINREQSFNVEKYSDTLYRLEDKEKNIVIRNFDGSASSTTDENGNEVYHLTDGTSSFVDSEDEIFGNSEEEHILEYEEAATLMLNATKMYRFFSEKLEMEKQSKSGDFVFFYNDGYDGGKNARGGKDSNGNGIISMGSVVGVEDIDVMAHEYTHLVSSYLVGFNIYVTIESKAINEALSDIYGELIEAYIRSNFDNPDWINTIDNKNKSRNMITPKASNNKEKLDELPNESELSPYDIETKGYEYSTLISHAAYLMWKGIDGDIDKKISSDLLAKLWYHTMLLLPSDCSFADCRKAVELAATSLELTAAQIKCIEEAFDQVGIYNAENDSTLCVYVLKSNAKLWVYDCKKEQYDNYTLQIDGSAWSRSEDDGKNVAGDRLIVEKTEVISTKEPYQLDLRDGEYRFEITDNLNPEEKKQYNIIINYENGQSGLLINTEFGGVPIRGTVSEKYIENGKEVNVPVENAIVTIASQNKKYTETLDMKGKGGIFKFYYPPGFYSITVQSEGYISSTISFEVVSGKYIDLPIVLKRDSNSIISRMQEAAAIAQIWNGYSKYIDNQDLITKEFEGNTLKYCAVKHPEIHTKQELIELTEQYYTSNIVGDLCYREKYCFEKNSKLYVAQFEPAYGDYGVGTELNIEFVSEQECKLSLYTFLEDDTLFTYSDFEYKYQDGRWKFDQNLDYLENVKIQEMDEEECGSFLYAPTLTDVYVQYHVINNSDYDLSYTVYDLDGDGIEELLVQEGTCEGDLQWMVYTLKGNKPQLIGQFEGWHSSLFVCNAGGIYCMQTSTFDVGHENIKLVTKEEDSLVEELVSERVIDFVNDNWSQPGTRLEEVPVYDYQLLKKGNTNKPSGLVNTDFYEFIKKELKISKNFPFPENVEDEIGVFSAFVKDFDDDGNNEMVTGSIVHNKAGQEYVVLDLYNIENGIIKNSDSSEVVAATGVGNFQNITCCIYEDGLIKIQSETINYGGSGTVDQYLAYSVASGKFVLENHFSSYARPVYDAYEYMESSRNITYSDSDAYNRALSEAGFDTKAHLHIGYADSEFDIEADDYNKAECFKNNHLFTLVSSAYYLTSDLYGFIYDNTNMQQMLSSQ